MSAEPTLTLIKVAYTATWAVMATAIVALPLVALRGQFRVAAGLTALIVAECAVLALYRGRCPLPTSRHDSPPMAQPISISTRRRWLAENNKTIFGALFVAGVGLAVAMGGAG